jgi:solute carrier family 35 protein F5
VTPKPSSSVHTFDDPPNPLLGDFLALLSAAFYAFYLLLLKIKIKTESRIDMQLFFGFVGLFNIIGCWPIGVILHFTGVEKIHLPTGSTLWAGIATSVGILPLSDLFY